jgi:hypothetical protein
MSISRTTPSTKNWNPVSLLFILAVVLATNTSIAAQGSGPAGGAPKVTFRERNRSMDDYDRDLDRLKIAEFISAARQRNLLVQINEDFQRIKVIHNEIMLMIRDQRKLNYDPLIDLGTELKKRGKRLRSNLALPSPKDKAKGEIDLPANEVEVKNSAVKLHQAVVSFVTNPMFTEPGILDVNAVNQASSDLEDIIGVSDRIKSLAEVLRRQSRLERE